MSLYKQGEMTREGAALAVGKIKAAFPALAPEFFVVLLDRAKAKGWTDEQILDAAHNVIDNCHYPNPTLANFLNFDRRVKMITYAEMCNLVSTIGESWSSYTRVRVRGKVMFVKQSDKELYNIPDEL